jgi:hypothetical protein
MKKVFVILLATFTITAQAETIINNSNKASPATVLTKQFEKSVGSIDFWQANNCEEAEKQFQKTKNAVMAYNADVGIAALSKKLDCPFNANNYKTVFIGKSYTKICSATKNPRTLANAKTIGMASVIYSRLFIDDINSNGFKLKGVPYGGSKDVLNALLAGDIDTGIIAAGLAQPAESKNLITCQFSTDPAADNYYGNTIKLKLAGLPIIQVFYTNSEDPIFIKKLEHALNDTNFLEFLNKHSYSDVKIKNITLQDIAEVRQHIQDRYNFYWK